MRANCPRFGFLGIASSGRRQCFRASRFSGAHLKYSDACVAKQRPLLPGGTSEVAAPGGLYALRSHVLVAQWCATKNQRTNQMKKIAVIAITAIFAGALAGCAGDIGVSLHDGLHAGAGISTPIGAVGGGFNVGGHDLVGAAAHVDTPVGGVGAHVGVGGHKLIGAGVHVDTPVGNAGLEGKAISRDGLIKGDGYIEPAGH
jgi:hypothetical protein